MQTTLKINVEKLVQFQELVKAHNLRFVRNPIVAFNRAEVCVDSDHLPPGGCNEFWREWDRVTTPIRETVSPKWKRLARRFGIKI